MVNVGNRGANVGGFTVPLAERVGPDGEVHAFEPFRKVFQHLNANDACHQLCSSKLFILFPPKLHRVLL